MAKRIIYYTAKESGCKPCEEITKLVEAGQFHSPDTDEIDLVDITTDEGFQRFNDEILLKQDGGVPSAYLEGKKCQIVVEGEVVHFECPGNVENPDNAVESPSNALPSSPDEKPSPLEEVASHGASLPDLPSELPSLHL